MLEYGIFRTQDNLYEPVENDDHVAFVFPSIDLRGTCETILGTMTSMYMMLPLFKNDPALVQGCMQRYVQFVKLQAKHANKLLVPTIEIAMIWQAHMLQPVKYHQFCKDQLQVLLAPVYLQVERPSLDTFLSALQETCQLWQDAYGTMYLGSISQMPTNDSIFNIQYRYSMCLQETGLTWSGHTVTTDNWSTFNLDVAKSVMKERCNALSTWTNPTGYVRHYVLHLV